MSSGAQIGFWIAIVILAILTGVTAGLRFQQAAEMERMLLERQHDRVDTLAEKYDNQSLKDLLQERKRKQAVLKKLRHDEFVAASDLLRISEIKKEVTDRMRDAELTEHAVDKKTLEIKQQYIDWLKQFGARVIARRDEDLAQRRDRWKEQSSIYASKTEQLGRDKEALKEREINIREAIEGRIRELESENSMLTDQLARVTEVDDRPAIALEPVDGRIIDGSVADNLLVINLGHADGVRRGMRFDVLRWDKNRYRVMGALEVSKVNPTSSNAVIVRERLPVMFDDKSGYTAKEPEERFSPFAAEGENLDKVVYLRDIGLEEHSTMDPQNPIVIGDFVHNPFFRAGRPLTFVLTGDPIAYPLDVAKRRIEFNGGRVVDKIDATTNVLYIGRMPDLSQAVEDEERMRKIEDMQAIYKRARRYGIPIMWEVNVVDFLRQ